MLKTFRLGATVNRFNSISPFYVSEHGLYHARDADFYKSLHKLSDQIRIDLHNGLYIPDRLHYVQSFVTSIDAYLKLRDGPRHHTFLCRIDEVVDYRGRRSFRSVCPTNYMSEEGETITEAISALGEVIEARYRDESITDLMREMPRKPLITSFSISLGGPVAKRQPEVSAIIKPLDGLYRAEVLDMPLYATATDPYLALQRLEGQLSELYCREKQVINIFSDEPVYGFIDVQLFLKDGLVVKRFYVSIASHPDADNAPLLRAYAPQAGVCSQSPTIDGALDSIRHAISLHFHEASLNTVNDALKPKLILTTAHISC